MDTMQQWLTVWAHADRILLGFASTLALFALGAALALLLACAIAFGLEGRANRARRSLRAALDALRMTPFLVYMYLLYFGLPEVGIRLGAWGVGIVALASYHACYFAEILRGARASLPQGQVEAACAHGLRTWGMYRRILLPQMLLQSAPLLGNQMVGCLKDTAFLSIVTVFELTAAANDVQAVYFVPMPAFITAIALYWLLSLGVQALVHVVERRARIKGLSHG